VFKGLSTSGLLGTALFWSGAGVIKAHDAEDRFVYNTTTGALYYDADGTGKTAAVQVGLLGGSTHPLLTASDLMVI
jgi:Ca2+-binding RTX toxin-like protein